MVFAVGLVDSLSRENVTKFSFGAVEIELRNPEFGNSETLDLGLTLKRTMTGKVYTYIQTPVKYVLKMSFEAVKESQRDDLITFLKVTAGQTLIFLNHNGETWSGKIIDPEKTFTQIKSYRNQFDITFAGEKVA